MKNLIKALRILVHLRQAVHQYSNDYELGGYIRSYVNNNTKPRTT